MKTSDFDFDLPTELIAQSPIKNRDQCRMLVLNKVTNQMDDKHFYDIVDYLQENDVLVLNDSKVIPARLLGKRTLTGGKVEVFLLHNTKDNCWQCLVKPARKIKVDDVVVFGNNLMTARCIATEEEGIRVMDFSYQGIFNELLNELGQMPLPPYIKQRLVDKDSYQTVYAKQEGSVAAPTAGLHFTDELLNKIKEKKVHIVYITLHVGLGTFKPVTEDNIVDHEMHTEYYVMNEEATNILNDAKRDGRRIIAVGTTVVRTLETVYSKYGCFKAEAGNTNIFILPGYKFQAISALITNFHLPKSTLIMLISAFVSKDIIMKTYMHAIKEKYRFFSFGDCLFITDK